MKQKTPPAWIVIAAFIAIYFIWGTTYLANLFALKSIPPFTVSCFRYLGAAALLGIGLVVRKAALPDRYSIKVLCISGILMLVGGSGMIVFAEQYIKSGYAAALIATEPLFFVLLDKKRWRFYFSSWLILSGLLLGFVGIGIFAAFAPSGSAADGHPEHLVAGTAIVLTSAILWVLGTLYADRHLSKRTANTTNTAVQLLAAGIFAGLIAIIKGEWNTFSLTTVSAAATFGLLYLIVMGSLVAYLAFTWLITIQPPAIVSTHTFVNPVVAIIMGWAIAGESITTNQTIALVIAFSGVILAQVGKNRLLSRPPEDRNNDNDNKHHTQNTHPDTSLKNAADNGASLQGQHYQRTRQK